MSNNMAGQWMKFFNNSGIPSTAAASYAHIFVENRIQTNMLMDLNKEYLREMGITPMGDIIAILRHAKLVNDQTAREKVLRSESTIPVAAVPASPATEKKPTKHKISSDNSSKVTLSTSLAKVNPMQAPSAKVRRVLPEHEGGYKIKLPSGSTERSKAILAKQAMLYCDRETDQDQNSIFQRLAHNSLVGSTKDKCEEEKIVSSNNLIKINRFSTDINNKTSTNSSIFSRLGGKSDDQLITKEIKPILKKTAKNRLSTIVKAKATVPTITKPITQKVILVKKVPVKNADNDEGDGSGRSTTKLLSNKFTTYMNANNGGNEKIVKFASTAEVREIAPLPRYDSPTDHKTIRLKQDKIRNFNIKSRLGIKNKLNISRKKLNINTTDSQLKALYKMKADKLAKEKELSVHQRLGLQKSQITATTAGLSTISKRLGNVSLKQKHPASSQSSISKLKSQSVFTRLNYNNK